MLSHNLCTVRLSDQPSKYVLLMLLLATTTTTNNYIVSHLPGCCCCSFRFFVFNNPAVVLLGSGCGWSLTTTASTIIIVSSSNETSERHTTVVLRQPAAWSDETERNVCMSDCLPTYPHPPSTSTTTAARQLASLLSSIRHAYTQPYIHTDMYCV